MKVEKKSSKNYEWFKFLGNNRKVSPKHIRDLEKEFDTYGNITEISPITVNSHGFIIDGQHRFLICRERKLEVHYNEINAKKEITPAMNSKKKSWSAMDYINFFAAYKPEYEALRQFINVNQITFPVASAVLFSNTNRKFLSDRKLKDGTLEVRPFIERAQKDMDIINDISAKMGSYMTERYVRGLTKCLDTEIFDVDRFMKRLDIVMKNNPDLPNPRLAALEDVLRNIESIYNYHSSDNNRVALFR